MSTAARVNPADFAPPSMVAVLRTRALIAGIAGAIAVLGLYAAADDKYHAHLLRSWLVSFMFWLGMTLGPLVLLMLQYVTGGNWGRMGRRFWEAATRCLPLMFLYWLPIAIWMNRIYPWVSWQREWSPEKLKAELGFKAAWYLTPNGFWIKGIAFFVIWALFAAALQRWSRIEEEGKATPQKFVNIQNLSGFGIVVYGLTITFAATDWAMSLNPYWFSSVWGMLFMVGECLTAFAFTVWLLARFSPIEPVSRVYNTDRLHDFGKLMFTFVILWAYLSFSQWLIIWSGNLTEEIRWYLDRIDGHWKIIAVGLILLHFFFPFFILLSRNLKKQAGKLVWVALLILFMRFVDLFWQIQPRFHATGDPEPLNAMSIAMTIACAVAMGGLWLAYFFYHLGRRSMMPVNDPDFPEMLAETQQHG